MLILFFRAGRAWTTMVAHMVEMGDTPTGAHFQIFLSQLAKTLNVKHKICFLTKVSQKIYTLFRKSITLVQKNKHLSCIICRRLGVGPIRDKHGSAQGRLPAHLYPAGHALLPGSRGDWQCRGPAWHDSEPRPPHSGSDRESGPV